MGVGDSTVPNPEAGDGNLPGIEFSGTYYNGENVDLLPEKISSNGKFLVSVVGSIFYSMIYCIMGNLRGSIFTDK